MGRPNETTTTTTKGKSTTNVPHSFGAARLHPRNMSQSKGKRADVSRASPRDVLYVIRAYCHNGQAGHEWAITQPCPSTLRAMCSQRCIRQEENKTRPSKARVGEYPNMPLNVEGYATSTLYLPRQKQTVQAHSLVALRRLLHLCVEAQSSVGQLLLRVMGDLGYDLHQGVHRVLSHDLHTVLSQVMAS